MISPPHKESGKARLWHKRFGPRNPESQRGRVRRDKVAQLKKQATPVWYLKAKDEGHGFGKKKSQDFQFYSAVAFIQEFLLN